MYDEVYWSFSYLYNFFYISKNFKLFFQYLVILFYMYDFPLQQIILDKLTMTFTQNIFIMAKIFLAHWGREVDTSSFGDCKDVLKFYNYAQQGSYLSSQAIAYVWYEISSYALRPAFTHSTVPLIWNSFLYCLWYCESDLGIFLPARFHICIVGKHL